MGAQSRILTFLSRSKPYLPFVWPAGAILIAASLWATIIKSVEQERAATRTALVQQAAAYADAYALYLNRSIAQMDQITMQLKHSWEHAARPALLEDMRVDGMFTDTAFVDVSIINRDGQVRSSTRARRIGDSYAHADFFAAHRDSNSSALRIGMVPQEAGAQAATTLAEPDRAGLPWPAGSVVLLTRRLDSRDDEFGGVVLMAIDAAYFTSFVTTSMLGQAGLLAVTGADGALRIEQSGRSQPRVGLDQSILPPREASWHGTDGVDVVEQGAGFADGRARALGWRNAHDYPVTALVALPLEDALAPVEAHWRNSRDGALAATLLLALLAALASSLTLRAAARERQQAAVRRGYRAATEHAKDGFYMVAPVHDRRGTLLDFRIVDCNEQGAWFYGYKRAGLVGLLLSQVHQGDDYPALFASYKTALDTGFFEEDRCVSGDPHTKLCWAHRRLVRVGDGLAVTLQDISERKAHEAQTARLVNEDSLTGLPNRHAFLQFAQQSLSRSQRDAASAAVLFIDLDDFKQVNDTHGHAAGDRMLVQAAQRLVALLRPNDRVARLGGDEFVVLLDHCEGPPHSTTVAQRIIDAFAQPFQIGEGMHALIGASVGISLFPHDGQDAATLIQHADMAMYAGKNDGKGQYRYFDHAISAQARQRMLLKQRLAEAIDARILTLHYQPRMDSASRTLRSMEALLRWQDPVLGPVSPADFIAVAETSGLILRIGQLVLDQACAQIAQWQQDGLAPVPVSINISPKQFARRGLARQVAAALAHYRIPAALLQIEITESAMMGEQDDVVAELAALRALGVALYVDDFGTGYSSLSQLQRLRMDGLKVDRAFTAQLNVTSQGRVFFQAIVSMAHALGMSIVAEGVETEAQLAALKEMGCDEAQGYLLARPMPPAQVAALLRQPTGMARNPDKATVLPLRPAQAC